MTLSEKIFALRSLPPLADMAESELAFIAEVARERAYAPGAQVFAAGSIPQSLLFVCGGVVTDAGGVGQGKVPGAAFILLGRPLDEDWSAGPDSGARCLQVARTHLFTIAQECPSFVVGLLRDSAPPGTEP